MGLFSTLGTAAGTYFGGSAGGAIGGALGGALEGGASTAGGMQQSAAAQQAAQQAAQASQFRPVGITNTFGTSNFAFDPNTGQMTSAGYSLSPQLQGFQNTLMGNQGQSLQDLSNIQAMGRQYMAASPQEQAQQYMANQQALLQPSRQQAQANLNTNLFNSGTGGLSTAQGGGLGMANPQQQALANAQAMQDLQLASQATQAGQQQYQFGQGLLSSAYQPYNTGLSTLGATEGLGQQPLELSASLAGRSATAGANAGKYMTTPAYSYSPSGTMLSNLGGASSNILGGLFNNTTQGNWGWGNPSGQFEGDINTSGFFS